MNVISEIGTGLTGIGNVMGPNMQSTAVIKLIIVIVFILLVCIMILLYKPPQYLICFIILLSYLEHNSEKIV